MKPMVWRARVLLQRFRYWVWPQDAIDVWRRGRDVHLLKRALEQGCKAPNAGLKAEDLQPVLTQVVFTEGDIVWGSFLGEDEPTLPDIRRVG